MSNGDKSVRWQNTSNFINRWGPLATIIIAVLFAPRYFRTDVQNIAALETRETIDKILGDKVTAEVESKILGTSQQKDDRAQLLRNINDIVITLDRRTKTIEQVLGLTEGRQKAVFIVLPQDKSDPAYESAEAMRRGIRSAVGGMEVWVEVRQPDGSNIVEKVALVDVTDFREDSNTIAEWKLLKEQYECVLVLGHSDSTRAKRMCETMYEPSKLPLILLGPTNPSIMSDAFKRGVRHYIRLLPNDNIQINEIVSIINEFPSRYKNIVIYWDKDNETYSSYIAEQIKVRLDAISTSDDRQIVPIPLVFETVPNYKFLNDYSDHRPDLIIYVGLTKTARAMIERWSAEIRSLQDNNDLRNTIDIIFTDGCTGALFLRFIRKEAGWGQMLVLSPMPKPNNADPDQVIDYGPVGVVAGHLAYDILDRAGRTGHISRQTVFDNVLSLTDATRDYLLRTKRLGSDVTTLPLELRTLDFRGSDDGNAVRGGRICLICLKMCSRIVAFTILRRKEVGSGWDVNRSWPDSRQSMLILTRQVVLILLELRYEYSSIESRLF